MPHLLPVQVDIRGQNQRLPVVMLITLGSSDRRCRRVRRRAYLVKSDFEGSKLLDTVSRFINMRYEGVT